MSSLHGKTMEDERIKSVLNDDDEKISMFVGANEEDGRLRSARVEIGQAREENQRLKSLLSQTVSDYQSLQMQFFAVLRENQTHKQPDDRQKEIAQTHAEENDDEDSELLSLTLGTNNSSVPSTDEEQKVTIKGKLSISTATTDEDDGDGHGGGDDEGLKIRRHRDHNHDQRFTIGFRRSYEERGSRADDRPTTKPEPASSCDNSFGEATETKQWARPSAENGKLKTVRSDEEVVQQARFKKARVSVRVRCDTPIMNDGCQWRKYGQKTAKGNPCPRAYYRCTVSPSCPVRKQVQRCADDMSVLITTYEGNHNHPLPISATAIASTTAAAASVLQCRSSSTSSSSQPQTLSAAISVSDTSNISTTTTMSFHGSNCTMIHPFTEPSQLNYFPGPSISTGNSHPTITLDLTTAPYNLYSHPNISSSTSSFPSFSSIYSSTFLNLSSSSSSSLSSSFSLDCATDKSSLSSNECLDYRLLQALNMNRHPRVVNHATPSPDHMQASSSQQFCTDTLSARTRVVAMNPSFQSALAAAITSFVSNGLTSAREKVKEEGDLGFNLKVGDKSLAPLKPPNFMQNSVGCTSKDMDNKPMAALNPQLAGRGSCLALFPHSSSAPSPH